MASLDQIRNNLIDKLISINNKEVLAAVHKLLDVSVRKEDIFKISEEQRKVLQASENDVLNDKLMSDEELNSLP